LEKGDTMLKDTKPYTARAILVGAINCLILSIATGAFGQGQSACDAMFACQNKCNAQAKSDLQGCLNNRGDVQVPPGQTLQLVCNNQTHRTVTSCLSKCGACNPASVTPDFILVSILYDPPGDKSTNAFGTSTAVGTNQTVTQDFGQSTSTKNTFSFSVSGILGGGPDLPGTPISGGVSVGVGSSSTSGTSTTSGVAVTTTTTSNTNLASSSDSENHDNDVFLLWLNPELVITQTSETGFSVVTEIGGTNGYMDIMPVTVGQLKNGIPQENLEDQKICPQSKNCFTVPGLNVLTAADKTALLAMDPFLSLGPTGVPDPTRYLFIEERPLENTQDSGGITEPFQVSDATVFSTGSGTSIGGSNSLTVGASFKISDIGFSTSTTKTWNWSINRTSTQTSGTTQTASVTLGSNTSGCCANASGNGVCEVDIYEDMNFRTFAFQPEVESCVVPGVINVPPPSLTGTVTCDQAPCTEELVMIEDSSGKVLRRIYSDAKGRYSAGSLPPGPVKVVIGSQTKEVQIEGGKVLQVPDTRFVQ
jgi:hypothetical protein